MNWTTPADIKQQVQKLWDRGVLLASFLGDDALFPLKLSLKGPSTRELSERFGEVRDWLGVLNASAQHYRLEFRQVNLRLMGENQVLTALWLDSIDHALALIGKNKDAARFLAMAQRTREQQPLLLPWLKQRPLTALKIAEDWPQLLAIVSWLAAHPRPGIYLRQLDLPAVHSKLIEAHQGVLLELLDLVLPAEHIDDRYRGIRQFCPRYGFLDKPLRVRFRVLDPTMRLLTSTGDQDLTLTQEAFASLALPVAKVFITENEINFLAFPAVANAIVIFGAGYGFENLAPAAWLRQRLLFYWGDIDTHGFAILNQLRGLFPQTISFLMDAQTFLAHRALWGYEAQPDKAALPRLQPAEARLYDQLRQNTWGEQLRLEQERIGFDVLRQVLVTLG